MSRLARFARAISRLAAPSGVACILAAGSLCQSPALAADCYAWPLQEGPASDTTGRRNTNYPEASTTTCWRTKIAAPAGSVVTVRGRFPRARFTALEVYLADTLVDHVNDVDIVPDPGQNNPFVGGDEHGLYTVTLVFGPRPVDVQPNTLYTDGLTAVELMYRIYHATDPADPAGRAGLPVLPDLALNGVPLASCPVQPFLPDPETMPWGRLDNADWIGTPPRRRARLPASDPPVWEVRDPYGLHYYPNGANYYMTAQLSRQFLQPFTPHNLYVVRFKAPTSPMTRRGELVSSPREVRFWSLCTDDPYTSNVNRCLPDDDAVLDDQGHATYVISDPGARPSDEALARHHARWLPWGALQHADDVVYDRMGRAWGTGTAVHYYNKLLYRQTLASDGFGQSFKAVAHLPAAEQPAAMGAYWPVGGYCSTQGFATWGLDCIGR